jgi:RNA polymerase sigma-70 factor (ECF subfamily)
VATSIHEMQWVLRAQCGDREAIELLLRAVQVPLRRYVAGLVGDSEADDVLQDVMVIVIRRLSGLEAPGAFRAWAFRIASREAFRALKRRRRLRDQLECDVALDSLTMPVTAPSGEWLDQLLATETLSPASRAVLMLHFQEELPLADVAAILSIPLGTVKSRLAYGFAALRKHALETGGSNGR